MNGFQTARETIAGKLSAAGAAAVTLDPRAPLPCVLVDAPTVDASAGVGGWATTVPVRAIAAPPGTADALAWLLDQLERVLVVYPGAVPATPGTVTRNEVDCPSYTVPISLDVRNPNC